MDLPVFELKINPEDDSLVDAIALVNEPAIESTFFAFSKPSDRYVFSSDEKMELIGAAMIPDQKIYRRDEDGKEYYVFFSKETIRQVAQTYFQKGFQSNVNLDHTTASADSFIFQSFIVDSAKGISSPKGLDLPDGSWVVGMKVMNKEVWKSIKEGKRAGFSVEGFFEFFNNKKEMKESLAILDEVIEMLSNNEYYIIK